MSIDNKNQIIINIYLSVYIFKDTASPVNENQMSTFYGKISIFVYFATCIQHQMSIIIIFLNKGSYIIH